MVQPPLSSGMDYQANKKSLNYGHFETNSRPSLGPISPWPTSRHPGRALTEGKNKLFPLVSERYLQTCIKSKTAVPVHVPQREKQCCQLNRDTIFYLINHRLHPNFRDAKK